MSQKQNLSILDQLALEDEDYFILNELAKLPDLSELWESDSEPENSSAQALPCNTNTTPGSYNTEPECKLVNEDNRQLLDKRLDCGSAAQLIPASEVQGTQLPSETNISDNACKTVNVEKESIHVLSALMKQRDECNAKAILLKIKLTDLKIEQKELCKNTSESQNTETQNSINENAKKQLEIQNKLKAIGNVVRILDGIVNREKENLYEKSKDPAEPNTPSKLSKTQYKYNYIHYDSEMYWCSWCNTFPKNLKEYLEHLHSKKHKANAVEDKEKPWSGLMSSEEGFPVIPSAPNKRTPIKGVQFLVASEAWYCKLCQHFMGDMQMASAHLKSVTHAKNYNEYIEQNPHYETDWISDRQKAFEKNHNDKLIELNKTKKTKRNCQEDNVVYVKSDYSYSSISDEEPEIKKSKKFEDSEFSIESLKTCKRKINLRKKLDKINRLEVHRKKSKSREISVSRDSRCPQDHRVEKDIIYDERKRERNTYYEKTENYNVFDINDERHSRTYEDKNRYENYDNFDIKRARYDERRQSRDSGRRDVYDSRGSRKESEKSYYEKYYPHRTEKEKIDKKYEGSKNDSYIGRGKEGLKESKYKDGNTTASSVTKKAIGARQENDKKTESTNKEKNDNVKDTKGINEKAKETKISNEKVKEADTTVKVKETIASKEKETKGKAELTQGELQKNEAYQKIEKQMQEFTSVLSAAIISLGQVQVQTTSKPASKNATGLLPATSHPLMKLPAKPGIIQKTVHNLDGSSLISNNLNNVLSFPSNQKEEIIVIDDDDDTPQSEQHQPEKKNDKNIEVIPSGNPDKTINKQNKKDTKEKVPQSINVSKNNKTTVISQNLTLVNLSNQGKEIILKQNESTDDGQTQINKEQKTSNNLENNPISETNNLTKIVQAQVKKERNTLNDLENNSVTERCQSAEIGQIQVKKEKDTVTHSADKTILENNSTEINVVKVKQEKSISNNLENITASEQSHSAESSHVQVKSEHNAGDNLLNNPPKENHSPNNIQKQIKEEDTIQNVSTANSTQENDPKKTRKEQDDHNKEENRQQNPKQTAEATTSIKNQKQQKVTSNPVSKSSKNQNKALPNFKPVRSTICFFCGCRGHSIYQCYKFKDLTFYERWDFVRMHERCHKCLGSHETECNKTWQCRVCGSAVHHTILHYSLCYTDDS